MLFGPPPPKKKGSGIRTVAIWLHAQVFVYASSSDIKRFCALKLQSNPFIENFYEIKVVFSSPHFNINDIFVHKKTHEVSTGGPLVITITEDL